MSDSFSYEDLPEAGTAALEVVSSGEPSAPKSGAGKDLMTLNKLGEGYGGKVVPSLSGGDEEEFASNLGSPEGEGEQAEEASEEEGGDAGGYEEREEENYPEGEKDVSEEQEVKEERARPRKRAKRGGSSDGASGSGRKKKKGPKKDPEPPAPDFSKVSEFVCKSKVRLGGDSWKEGFYADLVREEARGRISREALAIRVPGEGDRAHESEKGLCVYWKMPSCGFRLPLTEFQREVLLELKVTPSQLTSVGWCHMTELEEIFKKHAEKLKGARPTVALFRHYFEMKASTVDFILVKRKPMAKVKLTKDIKIEDWNQAWAYIPEPEKIESLEGIRVSWRRLSEEGIPGLDHIEMSAGDEEAAAFIESLGGYTVPKRRLKNEEAIVPEEESTMVTGVANKPKRKRKLAAVVENVSDANPDGEKQMDKGELARGAKRSKGDTTTVEKKKKVVEVSPGEAVLALTSESPAAESGARRLPHGGARRPWDCPPGSSGRILMDAAVSPVRPRVRCPEDPNIYTVNLPRAEEVLEGDGESSRSPEHMAEYAAGVYCAARPPYFERRVEEEGAGIMDAAIKQNMAVGLSLIESSKKWREADELRRERDELAEEKAKLTSELQALKEEVKGMKLKEKKLAKEGSARDQREGELREQLEQAKAEVAEAVRARLESEEEVNNLKAEMETREDKVVSDFLSSWAFCVAGVRSALGFLKHAIYQELKELGKAYPFTPEQLGYAAIPEKEAQPVKLKDYHWDKATDTLVDPDGVAVSNKVSLISGERPGIKYDWERDVGWWPEDIVREEVAESGEEGEGSGSPNSGDPEDEEAGGTEGGPGTSEP